MGFGSAAWSRSSASACRTAAMASASRPRPERGGAGQRPFPRSFPPSSRGRPARDELRRDGRQTCSPRAISYCAHADYKRTAGPPAMRAAGVQRGARDQRRGREWNPDTVQACRDLGHHLRRDQRFVPGLGAGQFILARRATRSVEGYVRQRPASRRRGCRFLTITLMIGGMTKTAVQTGIPPSQSGQRALRPASSSPRWARSPSAARRSSSSLGLPLRRRCHHSDHAAHAVRRCRCSR